MSLSTAPSPAIASYSYHNPTYTPLTPDNFIVSPAINLSSSTSPILRYKVKTQDEEFPTEHYAVYVATTNSVAAFLANPPVFEETVTDNGPGGVYYKKEVDLSAYHGQPQVYVAFRHFQSHDQFSIHIDDVMVGEKPAVVPNCATMVTPVNGTVNSPYKSVPLEWNAPTTGALIDSYDIYLDTNPNPTTLIGNTEGLTFTATDLNYSTTYYWKAVPKNVIGSAASCQVFSFSTRIKDYCDAGATTLVYEKISNVTFAGINNTTSATVGGSPAHEFFLDKIGTVLTNTTYPISMNANTDGTTFRHFFAVFIDWNQDGDFDDANEKYFTSPETFVFVLGSNGVTGTPAVGSIVVPENAKLGQTRMRVKSAYYGSTGPNTEPNLSNFANACVTTGSSFGQVEDYTIQVNSATQGTSNVDKAKVSVYPNPFHDVLNISDVKGVKFVSVSDVAGRQVKTMKAAAQLNLSDLKTGLYIVTLHMEDGSVKSVKAIKK